MCGGGVGRWDYLCSWRDCLRRKPELGKVELRSEDRVLVTSLGPLDPAMPELDTGLFHYKS